METPGRQAGMRGRHRKTDAEAWMEGSNFDRGMRIFRMSEAGKFDKIKPG